MEKIFFIGLGVILCVGGLIGIIIFAVFMIRDNLKQREKELGRLVESELLSPNIKPPAESQQGCDFK